MTGGDLIGDSGVASLLEVLKRERLVLGRLISHLSEASFFLEAHLDRPLVLATDDVDYDETHLGELEMLRAVIVAGIAATWDVPERELPLTEIIRRSGPEHRDRLVRELDVLRKLTGDIEAGKNAISTLAAERLASTRAEISSLIESPIGVSDPDSASV